MSATLQATTTVVQEIVLKPSVRRRLLLALNNYHSVKVQISLLQASLDSHKAAIEKVRDETGENSLSIDGFKVSLVSPVRSALDRKALLEAGVSMSQLEAGTITKPTKPYTKVTVPGDKESE